MRSSGRWRVARRHRQYHRQRVAGAAAFAGLTIALRDGVRRVDARLVATSVESRRTRPFEVLGAGYPYRLRFSTAERARRRRPARDPPTVVAHDVNDNPATDAVASPVSLTLAPAGAVARPPTPPTPTATVAPPSSPSPAPTVRRRSRRRNSTGRWRSTTSRSLRWGTMSSSLPQTVCARAARRSPCSLCPPPRCRARRQNANGRRTRAGRAPRSTAATAGAAQPRAASAAAGADGDPARAVGAGRGGVWPRGDGDGVGASGFGAALAAPPLRGGGARDGRRVVREWAVRRRA